MNEQKKYYTVLPAPIRYHKDLKPIEKIFYSEIASLCNEKGYCTFSNQYFADLYNVHKATISQYLASLQKTGFIISEIDKANGNQRKIYLSTF